MHALNTVFKGMASSKAVESSLFYAQEERDDATWTAPHVAALSCYMMLVRALTWSLLVALSCSCRGFSMCLFQRCVLCLACHVDDSVYTPMTFWLVFPAFPRIYQIWSCLFSACLVGSGRRKLRLTVTANVVCG